MIENPCDYIRRMSTEPTKLYHMTVRELMELREHVLECEECDRLTAETAEQNPEPPHIGFTFEVN